MRPSRRSTSPDSPKPTSRSPVRASSETSFGPSVAMTRASSPSVHQATPRVCRTRTPSLGPVFQSTSPVVGSSAAMVPRPVLK